MRDCKPRSIDCRRSAGRTSVGDVVAPPFTATLSGPESIDVAVLIDCHPLGPLQIRTAVLCGLTALLEGFDLLAISVAVPEMAESLRVASALLGTLLSAVLLECWGHSACARLPLASAAVLC